jgi:hypothetical protein
LPSITSANCCFFFSPKITAGGSIWRGVAGIGSRKEGANECEQRQRDMFVDDNSGGAEGASDAPWGAAAISATTRHAAHLLSAQPLFFSSWFSFLFFFLLFSCFLRRLYASKHGAGSRGWPGSWLFFAFSSFSIWPQLIPVPRGAEMVPVCAQGLVFLDIFPPSRFIVHHPCHGMGAESHVRSDPTHARRDVRGLHEPYNTTMGGTYVGKNKLQGRCGGLWARL